MIYLKTSEDIERMREANTLVSRTLGEIAKWVAPGVTTLKLDTIAREFICDNGGRPACLGYGGFPGTICAEVNEVVVHGFPSNYTLREGDIIGTDCVVEKDGFMGDSCYTFAVGEISPEVMKLCVTTKESLYKGIEACQEGKRIGDIANAVQTYCEARGYSVVREMCGHGIGKSMHEDPEVPNYGRRGTGPLIKNGMSVGIFIGPEGGFEESEINAAIESGAKIVSLGKRILRTETAAITATAMCMLHVEMNGNGES